MAVLCVVLSEVCEQLSASAGVVVVGVADECFYALCVLLPRELVVLLWESDFVGVGSALCECDVGCVLLRYVV